MNRLQRTIESLKAEKKKALVAFITAGYPDSASTVELAGILEKNGVDIIELGVPFSDPIADGPTIQYSSEIALRSGVTLDKVMEMVKEIRVRSEIPIVLMGYMNPLYRKGLSKTVALARKNGVDGFIVPDAIPEEADEVAGLCRRQGLSMIFMAAPNTPDGRLTRIDEASDAFVYVVSLTGVTGGRKNLPGDVKDFLSRTALYVKKHPRFVGFGISSSAQVRRMKKYVDGVIVGSALIEIIRRNADHETRNRRIAAFVRSLKQALR